MAVSIQYNNSTKLIFSAPQLHQGGGGNRNMRSDFFIWNSISNNFYLKLFCDAYFWQHHSLTFLYEIQFQTTFIWRLDFFYVMHIFSSIQSKSECNLPSQYNIIKDISECNWAGALCSEQLAQHFRIYMGAYGKSNNLVYI